MKKAFEFLKSLITLDRSNKETLKYDYWIATLVIFLVIYTSITYFYLNTTVASNKAKVVKIHLNDSYDTNTIKVVDTPTNKIVIIDTKSAVRFQEGEIAGVKHLGILGIVLGKSLGLNGYTYEIAYKDSTGVLQKIELPSWMLYKPQKEQLNPFSLLN